jgi:hypothetical protein
VDKKPPPTRPKEGRKNPIRLMADGILYFKQQLLQLKQQLLQLKQ